VHRLDALVTVGYWWLTKLSSNEC